MRVLRPGQGVLIFEGTDGEPSTRVEGKITSLRIFADLSIVYHVRWWLNSEPCYDDFSASDIQALDEPVYLSVE